MMCKKLQLKFSLTALLCAASLTGCANSWYPFVYRPPTAQGNVINADVAAQLKPGMTKDQVISVMGEPVLDTPLSADTWYYVYTLRANGKTLEHKQLTVYFKGDRVYQIV